MNQAAYTLVVTAGAVVLGLLSAAAFFTIFKKKKKIQGPAHWTKIGKIKDLYIYPMKSGLPTMVEEAKCTTPGLRGAKTSRNEHLLRDRMFAVYRADNGDFISPRAQPRVLRIQATPTSNTSVKFSFSEKEDLEIELPKKGLAKEARVKVWHEEQTASLDCGDEIATWLSEVILDRSSGLRLAYWDDSPNYKKGLTEKRVNAFSLRHNDPDGIFDLNSFMLMNESSLLDLNEKIKDKHGVSWFSVHRFRPNIVVEGPKPFDEDNWEWIRIGDSAVFKNFQSCTRCSITTIDPETGKRHLHLEPLKTLKTFRQLTDPAARKIVGESPAFGVYLGLLSEGIIKIGDPVYISA